MDSTLYRRPIERLRATAHLPWNREFMTRHTLSHALTHTCAMAHPAVAKMLTNSFRIGHRIRDYRGSESSTWRKAFPCVGMPATRRFAGSTTLKERTWT